MERISNVIKIGGFTHVRPVCDMNVDFNPSTVETPRNVPNFFSYQVCFLLLFLLRGCKFGVFYVDSFMIIIAISFL